MVNIMVLRKTHEGEKKWQSIIQAYLQMSKSVQS